jgi:type IV pilus assembly protein PilW
MATPGSIANCQIAQVDSTLNATAAPNTLPLGASGTLYNNMGLPVGIYNVGSVALHLGQTPIFTMFGINTNNSLEQFDLLNLSGTPTSVIADGVFDMRARYGVVAADGLGAITWVEPTGTWGVASLTAGTVAAANLIDRIRAVRISMVFRSTEPVKDASPPTSYTMFPDATPVTVSIPTANQLYRYQVYDTVVPLRNLRFVPPCTAAAPLPRCA